MRKTSEKLWLGIECGGTRTTVILADERFKCVHRAEFGPANLKLLGDSDLEQHFSTIAGSFNQPAAIGVGMAGARTEADWERVKKVVRTVWGEIPVAVTNDLEIALLSVPGEGKSRVLVLSGTGSCCYGVNQQGKRARMGGWGHLLGDKGSGYEIGLRALKASIYYFDRDGTWGSLGQSILRQLLLNEPNDLVEWIQRAGKRDIAALAPLVFESSRAGDKVGRDILSGAANSLAKDAVSCARKLVPRGTEVEFLLSGSVLLKQPQFSRKVGELVRTEWPTSVVQRLQGEGAWGAVRLAARAGESQKGGPGRNLKSRAGFYVPPLALTASPTEKRNPRSKNLDKLTALEGVRLMLGEERRVVPALLRHEKEIARAAEYIRKAMVAGGRLFYAGAGTSGRLGVLDASECPPTFRAHPDQVQGIVAGGERALRQAVEGAEDDALAGAEAVRFRGVQRKDVLVGIAASGRTPFVWGALAEAKKRGAKTVLLSFNPALEIQKQHAPDVLIAVDLGPEVLTGSTRLKSGTATKLVLNIFSTLGMVAQGKVISNLMIDLNPSNTKLRDRAVRIIRELTGVEATAAQEALARNNWVLKSAFRELTESFPPAPAKASPSVPAGKRSGRGRSKR